MKIICEPACENDNYLKPTYNFRTLFIGILVLIMPKCAICWASYLYMLGAVGIPFIPYQSWFLPLLILLFLITLSKLLYKAYFSRSYLSFILALSAGILIILQKLWFKMDLFNYLSMGIMFCSTLIESKIIKYIWINFFIKSSNKFQL